MTLPSLPDEFDLTVTKKHAAKGIVNSVAMCPVAMAAREQFGIDIIHAGKRILNLVRMVGPYFHDTRYLVPPELRLRISRFDEGQQGSRAELIGTYHLVKERVK